MLCCCRLLTSLMYDRRTENWCASPYGKHEQCEHEGDDIHAHGSSQHPVTVYPFPCSSVRGGSRHASLVSTALSGHALSHPPAHGSRACGDLCAWRRMVRRRAKFWAPPLAQSSAGCAWVHHGRYYLSLESAGAFSRTN